MPDTKQIGRNDQENLVHAAHGPIGEPVDRRSARTRLALHQALIQLVLERDYDEITVGDITDKANVGRSTFYAHYTDKDDLLRSGIGHLRALLQHEHARATAGETRPDLRALGFSGFMTSHIKEQHRLYRALMRGRAGPIMVEQIRRNLCDIVRAELSANGAAARPGGEFAVQFIVGAYMSIITWWLDRGGKETPEEINQAFRGLAANALSGI